MKKIIGVIITFFTITSHNDATASKKYNDNFPRLNYSSVCKPIAPAFKNWKRLRENDQTYYQSQLLFLKIVQNSIKHHPQGPSRVSRLLSLWAKNHPKDPEFCTIS